MKYLILLLGSAFALIGACTGDQAKPVKVFLLSGQSNMVGRGMLGDPHAENASEQKATLARYVRMPENIDRYEHLYKGGNRTASGWTIRDDVFITVGDWPHGERGEAGWNPYAKHGGLAPHYGSFRNLGFGPELGIGDVLGNYYDEPVVLVKVSFGSSSLGRDFRPPSSGGALGDHYPRIVKAVREAIENLDEIVPGYTEAQGYEIAGFFWNQGTSDSLAEELVDEYETNLIHLIEDLREALGSPGMKVVVAVTGNEGWNPEQYGKSDDPHEQAKRNQAIRRLKKLQKAQLSVAKRAEFEGSVLTVETRDFWRDRETHGGNTQVSHWHGNGESYWLIGEAMGKGMLELLRDEQ